MSVEIPMSLALVNMQEKLQQNNDLFGGKRSLYANREVYISKLTEQEDEDYDAMVGRAPAYILYPGVVRGFVGSTFQKDPKQEIPENDLMGNIDLLGNSLDQYAPKIVEQVLKQGFCASIVDYSDTNGRTFVKFIRPEQFISHRVQTINGIPQLTRFIYMEYRSEEDPENEFETKTIEYRIVHDLQSDDENLNLKTYRIRTYKESEETAGDFELTPDGTSYPLKNKQPLSQIPIVIHGTEPNNFSITSTPLQDISDLNISVYQRTVDQVHMLHYTALPTPWVTGVAEKEVPDTVGPESIWGISNEMAKVGLLEFSGSSAKAHQDFIDNLKLIMAQIGAQILKQEGLSRETATSVLIRSNNQTSIIETIINNISSQLVTLLELMFDWDGISYDDLMYELNTDFIRVDMDPNAQIALVKSWLDGAISHKSLFDKMQQGEIIPADKTYEEELADIEKYPPPAEETNTDTSDSGSNLETGNELDNPLEAMGQQ